MEEWKEYKLGDISTMKYGKLPPSSTGKLYPIWSGYRYVGMADTSNCSKGTMVVVARGVGGTGDVKVAKEDCYLTNLSIAVDLTPNVCNPYYLYYKYLIRNLKYLDSGSAQSQITIDALKNLLIELPPLDYQNRIVSVFKSLDDKIEVNKRINENLEQQVQALFKSWFVDFEPFKDGEFVESELGMIPKGWRVESLSSIGDYINGLAMQKYRPEEGEKGLPVLKIRELGQGCVDENSELCSPSLIGEKYIINDGDIIFSWSGTLMVKVWCGGKCGLNQHLFVVVPKDYQKWFVYQWTKYHLDNFIRIAKDKAVTMGHIKRGELDKAKVIIPDSDNLTRIDALMDPIFNQIISNEIESRRLATLRDTLLPKLMSGELKVNDIKE